MAFVQRANVVLEVSDDAVERMLDMGYNLINESGTIIQRSTAKDYTSLSVLYQEALNENAELKEQIKKLEKRKTELEASYKEAQRNIAFLVKHQKEIAEIKTEEGEKLEQIAEAKTDEEIFEIVNSVIAPNHSGM